MVSHWVWDSATPGWLNAMGYHDFAGSSVVHMVGGVIALVACILVGPRSGRFDAHGKPVDMPGHSVPLVGLGGFVLLFGFLAFNGGSQVSSCRYYPYVMIRITTFTCIKLKQYSILVLSFCNLSRGVVMIRY